MSDFGLTTAVHAVLVHLPHLEVVLQLRELVQVAAILSHDLSLLALEPDTSAPLLL